MRAAGNLRRAVETRGDGEAARVRDFPHPSADEASRTRSSRCRKRGPTHPQKRQLQALGHAERKSRERPGSGARSRVLKPLVAEPFEPSLRCEGSTARRHRCRLLARRYLSEANAQPYLALRRVRMKAIELLLLASTVAVSGAALAAQQPHPGRLRLPARRGPRAAPCPRTRPQTATRTRVSDLSAAGAAHSQAGC